jgi:digeranylgeranylglycerophospholipid reductase
MYDVVVCGGGPCGLTFSRYVAEKGFDVVVLEKKRTVGEPRHDSGATYPETICEHGLPIDVVANRCNGVVFETPTRHIRREFSEEGYILDRRRFDRVLAQKAVDAGVVIEVGAHVSGGDGRVHYRKFGRVHEVEGRLTVDATGGENSVLAVQKGLSHPTGKATTTVEYEVFCRKIDTPTIAHHGLGDFAPHGYAWIYPTGDKSAVVGCSQIGEQPAAVRNTLEYFMKTVLERRAHHPVPVEIHVCTNSDYTHEKTYADRLLVMGSAAKHNNPLWNEGIRFVMHQAKRNADICSKLLEKDRLTAKDLKACEDDWKKNRGSMWDYLKDVHEKGSRLTNEQWDSLLDVLESVDDALFIRICKSELTRKDIVKSSVKLAKLVAAWK